MEDLSKVLAWIFMTILPNFCLGQALEDFYSNYQALTICDTVEMKIACIFAPQKNPCCKGKQNLYLLLN